MKIRRNAADFLWKRSGTSREHFSVEAAWSVIAEDFSLQPGPQEDLAS